MKPNLICMLLYLILNPILEMPCYFPHSRFCPSGMRIMASATHDSSLQTLSGNYAAVRLPVDMNATLLQYW